MHSFRYLHFRGLQSQFHCWHSRREIDAAILLKTVHLWPYCSIYTRLSHRQCPNLLLTVPRRMLNGNDFERPKGKLFRCWESNSFPWKQLTVFDSKQIFSNCSCGVDTTIVLNDDSLIDATEGACGFTDCQQLWIIFQALTIFGAALLGSGLIGNLIITIRCVLPQDKSLALSMELFLSGLIVYIPGKIGYQAIAGNGKTIFIWNLILQFFDYRISDSTCQFWSSDQQKCFLHDSPSFGNILNIVTASLIAVSIFFDVLVFIFVQDIDLYGEEIEDNNYRLIPMQTYASNENATHQQAINTTSNTEGLLSNS